MKHQKGVKLILILSALLALSIVLNVSQHQRNQSASSRKNDDVTVVLYEKIENLAELNTAVYMCTNIKEYSDSKSFKRWNVPLTTKSFMISYDGTVKAGISDLQKTEITKTGNTTITVNLPEIEITNCTIDPDSLHVYAQSNNPLNPIKVGDVNNAQAEMKAEMIKRAEDTGIKETALENAKSILTSILNCEEARGYTIVFK